MTIVEFLIVVLIVVLLLRLI